jgi:hypothetical protein
MFDTCTVVRALRVSIESFELTYLTSISLSCEPEALCITHMDLSRLDSASSRQSLNTELTKLSEEDD